MKSKEHKYTLIHRGEGTISNEERSLYWCEKCGTITAVYEGGKYRTKSPEGAQYKCGVGFDWPPPKEAPIVCPQCSSSDKVEELSEYPGDYRCSRCDVFLGI